MSSRSYHEPKLVSALAPLMYEFIKRIQIKNIHPCQFVTVFREVDDMYEVKKLSSPIMTREIFFAGKRNLPMGTNVQPMRRLCTSINSVNICAIWDLTHSFRRHLNVQRRATFLMCILIRKPP